MPQFSPKGATNPICLVSDTYNELSNKNTCQSRSLTISKWFLGLPRCYISSIRSSGRLEVKRTSKGGRKPPRKQGQQLPCPENDRFSPLRCGISTQNTNGIVQVQIRDANQQLNMEGGQFHSQFHQSTINFVDHKIKVRKTHTKRENMNFKEIEAKNKICSTYHKYITRGGINCFPTSWVKLQMKDEWNPRCRNLQIPKLDLLVRIQSNPNSTRCVEHENGLSS